MGVLRKVAGALALALALVLSLTPGAAAAGNVMITVAGTGAASSLGDGGPGASATMNAPRGMVRLADGSLLVAESGGNRIRKLAPDGTITTVAGTGAASSLGDGLQATLATIYAPRDVAIAPDGVSFYIAEAGGNRIRKVDASGFISTIAGTGAVNSTGDGGPANIATLNYPSSISLMANGNLLIADTNGRRIRMIAADGFGGIDGSQTITTVAGLGGQGYEGDGGPAVTGKLSNPEGVLALPSGGFLISDTLDSVIRKVDASGIITTIYGTGATCVSITAICGDGQAAAGAQLKWPIEITADGAGGYLIADSGDNRIRRVSADGTITTVIGVGGTCSAIAICGDGGPSEVASITTPRGVLALPDGTFLITDATNRLRARVLDLGDIGPAGPPGPAGADGSDGSPGANGADGADGADGSNGVAGQDGMPGSNGPIGPVGPVGPSGPSGAQGVSGPPIPLSVFLSGSRIKLRARSHVRLRLFVTGGATVTVRVTSGSRTVRTVKRTFKKLGRKSVDLSRLKRGKYRVVVTAKARGKKTSVDRAALLIR